MNYLIKRIARINYKNFFTVIKRLHKKTGKNTIFLFFDVVHCGLKYKAGYIDYELLEKNIKNI